MAHELTQNSNGQYEMAYAGKKPWHGLGQSLSEAVGAEQMIEAANLNWSVSKRELITTDGIGIEDHVAIIRDDNSKPLSVVGDDYSPVQNTEAFAFFESVVGQGNAKFETAGSIFGGKRVFMVAKLPTVMKVGNNDITENYLTLFNSHDGTLSLKMFFTPIRVVCNNTLNAALKGAINAVSIRHSGDIQSRITEAQSILGMSVNYFHKFEEIANHLNQKILDKQMVDSFLKNVFVTKTEDEETSTRTKNTMNAVMNLFENDPTNNLDGMKGTAWSLYNATTQYADHEAISVRKNADMRMNSIMLGSGATLKQKAFNSALALI